MPLIRPAAALLMISLCGGAHDFSEMGRRRVLFAHRDLNARHVYTEYRIYIYIPARRTRLTVCLCAHKVLCIYNIAMIQARSCAQISRCRGLTRVI